jgi:MFS family permease
MDENPYKATVELSNASVKTAEELRRRRRVRFGYLIIGTICGAAVGGLLTAFLMSIYGYEIPRTPLGDAYFAFVPVGCIVPLACVGALGGAIWEYYARK